MAEEMARVNLLVIGEVQGVFYRASCLEKAQSLSLTGSVRNAAGGEVEIEAEGSKYSLEELIAWCKQGPPDARVQDVIVRWGKFTGEFRTFMIDR